MDNVLSQESGTAFLVLREFFLFLRDCFFLVCFGKLAAVSDNANKSIISSSFLEVASFGLALKERRLTDLFFSSSSQIGN